MKTVLFERPWMYPKQEAAVFNTAPLSVIEASTKAGKTFSCLAWIIERAMMGGSNWNHWWVAPVSDQANIAFARMKRQLNRDLYVARENPKRITLISGGTIWFKSADNPDSLYGEDVFSAVVDEASRTKEDSYIAIRTTLVATRGWSRIIGNVKGRKNWFYRLARRAEAQDEPWMEFHRITAWDAIQAGVLDTDVVETERRALPEHLFRELFEAEAVDDEGNPFGIAHIRACIAPLSRHPIAAWGIDLAKRKDWTVMIGLDRTGHVVRFERFRDSWGAIVRRIKHAVGKSPALVDSTGVGDPIVEELHRALPNIEGYHFTPASKQQLMEGLAVDIQSGAVGFPAGPIQHELEMFEYEYRPAGGIRYSAPDRTDSYDDCVIALALARQCQRTVRTGRLVVGGLMGG